MNDKLKICLKVRKNWEHYSSNSNINNNSCCNKLYMER